MIQQQFTFRPSQKTESQGGAVDDEIELNRQLHDT